MSVRNPLRRRRKGVAVLCLAAAASLILLAIGWVISARVRFHPTLPTARAYALVNAAVTAYGGAQALESPPHEIDDGMIVFKPMESRWRYRLLRRGMETRCDTFGITAADYRHTECHAVHGEWRQSDGIVTLLHPDQSADIALDWAPGSDLVWLKRVWQWMGRPEKPSLDLIYPGLRRLPDGRTVEGISLTTPDHQQIELDFDPVTKLVAAVSLGSPGPGSANDAPSLMEYLDRRRCDGIPLSFQQDFYQKEHLYSSIILSSIDRQKVIPDSVFAHPVMTAVKSTTTVPFEYQGLPIISGSINGSRPLRFLVDTGSHRILLSSEAAAALALHSTTLTTGAAWAGPLQSESCRLRSFRVGKTTLRNLDADIIKSDPDHEMIDKGLAGLLGYNFLGLFQITLDYGAQRLILAPRTSPVPDGAIIPFTFERDQPWVTARVGKRLFPMLLDTGTNVVSVPPGEIDSLVHGPILDNGLRSMWGRTIKSYVTRLPSLSVAGQALHGLPVYFLLPGDIPKDDQYDPRGELGSSFLEHFRVTLDYARQLIVFKRVTARYADSWTGPGIGLGTFGSSPLPIVNAVVPGSPAARAGVKYGDEVARIAGKPTAGVPRWILWNKLRGPAGTSVTITVLHQGHRKIYRLKRVRLLDDSRIR